MFTFAPNHQVTDFAAQVGIAAGLLGACDRKRFRIASLQYWLTPAIRLKQIKFFFDETGNPVGYLTWAFVSTEVSQSAMDDKVEWLHLSEWNEGLNLWIVDLVAPYGHAKNIALYARNVLFPHHEQAFAVRRADDGRIRRVVQLRRALLRKTALKAESPKGYI